MPRCRASLVGVEKVSDIECLVAQQQREDAARAAIAKKAAEEQLAAKDKAEERPCQSADAASIAMLWPVVG